MRCPSGLKPVALLLFAAAALSGCSMNPLPPEPVPTGPMGGAAATSKAAPAMQPAPAATALSYGTVTSQVQKGKTTQVELLQLFGGPNISTTDGSGAETWVYERSVTQTDVQQRSQAMQGAVSLGAFFNFGNVQASGGGERAQASSSTSSSFRSLTVIVKFAADKTVADYSVRSSTF